ncbi:unnamed protein product [Ranitomeya imitator]|uniref:Uncharacterized protein n=1 Tax=Ranitomeya imitator TaxID=111125 RepID=A0ABN9LXK7_9NEOB|nr:unnamed protein product [Ranitomeya imitator]
MMFPALSLTKLPVTDEKEPFSVTLHTFCPVVDGEMVIEEAVAEVPKCHPVWRYPQLTPGRLRCFITLTQSAYDEFKCLDKLLYEHALDMTGNGSVQLIVKAKFNFKQQNEDELSFSKGDTVMSPK